MRNIEQTSPQPPTQKDPVKEAGAEKQGSPSRTHVMSSLTSELFPRRQGPGYCV